MINFNKLTILFLGYTFNTAGVRALGPLEEKDAMRGDNHAPVTVVGEPSFAIGDLHNAWTKLTLKREFE